MMPQVMTEDEYTKLANEQGGTYASWEVIDRLLKRWFSEHPDDERMTIDVMDDPEFLAWIES